MLMAVTHNNAIHRAKLTFLWEDHVLLKPATCCHSLAPLSYSLSPKIACPVVVAYYD